MQQFHCFQVYLFIGINYILALPQRNRRGSAFTMLNAAGFPYYLFIVPGNFCIQRQPACMDARSKRKQSTVCIIFLYEKKDNLDGGSFMPVVY